MSPRELQLLEMLGQHLGAALDNQRLSIQARQLAVDAARHCLVLPWLAGQSLDRLFAAELPVITPDPLSVTDPATSVTARRFAIEAADLSLLTDVGQLGQIGRLDGKAACRHGGGGVGDRQRIRGDDR